MAAEWAGIAWPSRLYHQALGLAAPVGTGAEGRDLV